jgi:excisionase family DNA binding protein
MINIKMQEEKADNLLTINEAAEKMHVSRQTIYAWIASGKIKTNKTPGGRQRILESLLISVTPDNSGTEKPGYYKTYDISTYEPSRQEPTGLKEKFWFSNRDNNWYWGIEGNEFLFKVGRPGTGENWAEVVACELCKLIGLPHAEYSFAKYKDKEGVITPSFVPSGTGLILGNEILQHIVKGYNGEQRYHQRKHTLPRVISALSNDTELPIHWDNINGIIDAIDVFIGYLMFDSWIANTDRHHENWGVVRDHKTNKYHLAPTFDHASSLGSHENDSNRNERLSTKDLNRKISLYVTKARSALYSKQTDESSLYTIDAFKEATKNRETTAKIWLERLNKITIKNVIDILNRVPDILMSGTTKAFTREILIENRRRLLDLQL